MRVRLVAAEDAELNDALLALVPSNEPLWRNMVTAELAEIDWQLAAEIALHHEPALRAPQVAALQALMASARESDFARLNSGYTTAAPGGAQALPR